MPLSVGTRLGPYEIIAAIGAGGMSEVYRARDPRMGRAIRWQQGDGRWVIVDLRGKGGRIRTVPVPAFVKAAIDCWAKASGLAAGRVLRAVDRHERVAGSLSEPAIWGIAAHWGELPKREQRILLLRFYGDLTQAEIGKQLGISQMQVSRLLAHALGYLRQCLLGLRETGTGITATGA